MRLLLDEMYPPGLAGVLRASGLDAHTVVEAGLAGRPDADVLAATSPGRRSRRSAGWI